MAMLLKLRVSLPDRPGSLGKIARVLGVLGADIVQVVVLDQEEGRALDDFSVRWPDGAPVERIVRSLAHVHGVHVEGVWATGDAPGAVPELDVLGHAVAAPEAALARLVDAAPQVFSADWAVAIDVARPAAPAYASPGTPTPLDAPEVRPLRPTAFSVAGGMHYAAAPISSLGVVLLVARRQGAKFHRVELLRLERLIEVVEAIVRGRPGATPVVGRETGTLREAGQR
jgi:hypothetical protein